MKVLLISYVDYAGLAGGHAEALRVAGVDAESLVLKGHEFGYGENVVTRDCMWQEMTKADAVIVYHSHPVINSVVVHFVSKFKKPRAIIAFHSGSIYRKDPETTLSAFGYCDMHLTDQCEFLADPVGKDLGYVAAAVQDQPDNLFPDENPFGPVFAHFPSNPVVKGSADIIGMMGDCGISVKYSDERVSHADQIKRMKGCDVYVELYRPEIDGRPYGCWGVTAFEAAMLGKIVITQNIYIEAYTRAYGVMPPLRLANTREAFRAAAIELARMPADEILSLQKETQRWAKKYHSMKPTGERLRDIILKL